MQCRFPAVLAIGCLLGAALPSPAWAQEKIGGQRRLDLHGVVTRDIVAAAELAEIGRKDRAPEAFLAAGGLLLRVHAYTGGRLERVQVPGADAPAEAVKSFKAQAEDLFDEARIQGAKPTDLEPLIRAIRKRDYTATSEYQEFKISCRAVRPLLKQISRKVPAGGSHSFVIPFDADEPASVALRSDVPVRFRVGQPGKPSLVDTVATATRFTWTPEGKSSRKVKVEVLSEGKAARYTLFVHD